VTDYNMTLLHEMAHATGHPTRLNRSLKNSFGSEAYAKEELRASIGSSMNARILGIALDPGALHEGERDEIENEAAYIKSWLSALPEAERKAELLAAITAAQKISDYVLGLALPQQEDVTQVVEALTVSGANTGSEGTSGAVANEPDGVPFGTKVRL
jgi:antirestriction protein ArdC